MTTWPPEAWTFTYANGEVTDMLWIEQDRAKRAALQAFVGLRLDAGSFEWRAMPGRGHIRQQQLYRSNKPTGFRVFVQPWADAFCEGQCAWHTLQIRDVPDSFTGDRAEVTCPDECRQLPPGAVCWYVHEPRRAEWPTEPGTYRIRPYHHTVQRGEDGDVEVEFQIQAWDSTVPCWWPTAEAGGGPF